MRIRTCIGSSPAIFLFFVLVFSLLAQHASAIPAFPGAEGFGSQATGGRGGTVYVVTNLNDSGPGSFRDAVSQPNRTVVFAVGGIIRLNSRVSVRANITIAGQTAPGEGITLYGNGLSFSDANNAIVRYIRIRMGVVGDSGVDAVSISTGDTMIFDHVSVSWGRDETFSVSGSIKNVTIQDSIIAQGLQTHSAGGLIQTDGGVSLLRNLYIDNHTRNPKVKGVNEFTNNVVYNWGSGGAYILGDSAGQSRANIENNYFIAGPDTGIQAFTRGNLNFHVYAANNIEDANRNGILDGTVVPRSGYTTVEFASTRFPYPPVATLLTPEEAYNYVSANAGASFRRDRIDNLLVEQLRSLGREGLVISNENQVGGPGPIAGGTAPLDTDRDGIPNWWEQLAGLDPNVADNNGDADGNGYTNLEEYINSLVPGGVQRTQISKISSDSGRSDTDAITTDDTLSIEGSAPGGASVTIAKVAGSTVGTVTANAEGRWTLDLTGTPLAEGSHAFTATSSIAGGPASPPTPAFVVRVDKTAPAAPEFTSVILTPAVTINGSSEPLSSITVTQDSVGTVGTAVADEFGNWSAPYNRVAFLIGSVTFTATATDQAGNTSSSTSPYLVNTALAAPAISAISNDTGASSDDRITSDTTLTFTGTAPAGSNVVISRAGSGVTGIAAAGSDGKWTFDAGAIALAPGTHSFFATATENGVASPGSEPFSVTIDTAAPIVASIARLEPASAATASRELTYRVTFAEPVSGVGTNDFQLTATGASATVDDLSQVSDSVYNVHVKGVSGEGTLRLDLKNADTGIVDVAGNTIATGFTTGQVYTVRLPGSGVWLLSDAGGSWSNAANWQDGVIPSGAGATADFNTLDLTEDTVVRLDAPHTLGHLTFGDTDPATPAIWLLEDGEVAANALTLDAPGGSPSITVNALGAERTATIASAIKSTAGLTKNGTGELVLSRPNTIEGPLAVNRGRLSVGPKSTLKATTVAIGSSGSQLHVAGGSFEASELVTITAGGSSGIVVSDGTAAFPGGITTSNTRDAVVRVTGGTLTASKIDFPRTSDSSANLAMGLVVQGGVATVETIALGTNNSWGTMSVEGGTLNVTGPVFAGMQTTAGRGAQIRVTGGALNIADDEYGLVLARNPGTQPNNVAGATFTGGVSTIQKITLGYDDTSSAGSGTLTINGGALYLGSGGIVKKGAGTFAANVNLMSGTLGAFTDWSTTVPLTLPASSTVAIRAADNDGVPREIALAAPVTGAGGFTKTGAGRLTLTAANTFTGAVAVNAGELNVTGSTAATSPISVNSSGMLAGTGSIAGPVLLNNGGIVSPASIAAGTLTVASLVWNPGGQMLIDIGTAVDRIAVTGAFTRAASGLHAWIFRGPSLPAPGTTFTLATFGSTNFTPADFVAIGLTGTFTMSGTSLQFTVANNPAAEFSWWLGGFPVPDNQRGLTDDPDGDGLGNLLEFVLNLDPSNGGSQAAAITTVTVDSEVYPALQFMRRRDIGPAQWSVQVAGDLQFNSSGATVVVSSVERPDGNFDMLVRSAEPLSQRSRQFFRIVVSAGADALRSPMYGAVSGRATEGLNGLSLPLLHDVFAGRIESNTGTSITLDNFSRDVSEQLTPGTRYYIEITTFPFQGERFDIAESTGGNLMLDLSETSHSTLSFISPNALVNARGVIRRHTTLSDIAAAFTPGLVANDTVTIAGGDGVVYTMAADNASWQGGEGTADLRGTVIPPDASILVDLKSGAKRYTLLGAVRQNAFRKNLIEGPQTFTTGFPVDMSPAQVGAFTDAARPPDYRWFGDNNLETADRFLVFDPAIKNLSTYLLLLDGSTWAAADEGSDLGLEAANAPVLKSPGAIVLIRTKPDPGYVIYPPVNQ